MREILGKAKTVRELLKGVKYSIDYYQREYKWHEKQVHELVDDLSDKFLEEYDPTHPRQKVADYPRYFLGSIIISKKESASYIVDGQQRLTSLTLLLTLLRNLQKDRPKQVNVDELIFSERFDQKSFNLHVGDFERVPVYAGSRRKSARNLRGLLNASRTAFGYLVNRWDLVYQNTSGLSLRTMKVRFAFNRYLPLALAVFAACALESCATYSRVSERRPRFIPFAGGGPLANAATYIVTAMRIDRRDPLIALGEYMSAAETALDQLKRNPNDNTARNTYNFAVGRIIATIRDTKLDPWTQPLRVPANGGEFVLTHRPDPRPQWNPALYDFTPADQFDVRGTYVTERTTRDGIGAPVVAVGREANKEARANFSLWIASTTALPQSPGLKGAAASYPSKIPSRWKPSGLMDGSIPLPQISRCRSPWRSRAPTRRNSNSRGLLNPAKYAETARIVEAPTLRSEQNCCTGDPWAHGHASNLGTDDQSPPGVRGDPAQLPVLVLQLPERLSLSLFRGYPAA